MCLLPPHPSLSACHGLLTGRYLPAAACTAPMTRSSLPSRAASVGPVGHRPERKARGWRGGSALTTQGLGSPSTAGPGAPAAPWGRSGQCLLGLSPCCQEHILAISDRARDLGRISLSFPRAFNKLPPFPPLHLPELRIIHTHTHTHTRSYPVFLCGRARGREIWVSLLGRAPWHLPTFPSRCSALQTQTVV